MSKCGIENSFVDVVDDDYNRFNNLFVNKLCVAKVAQWKRFIVFTFSLRMFKLENFMCGTATVKWLGHTTNGKCNRASGKVESSLASALVC